MGITRILFYSLAFMLLVIYIGAFIWLNGFNIGQKNGYDTAIITGKCEVTCRRSK